MLKEKGVTKWLFPQQFTADANHMTGNDFGKFLGDTTQRFTELRADGKEHKRISSSILRIMFITWYHNNTDSVFDQVATKAIMVKLHQTDLDTHVSYIKNLMKIRGEEDDEVLEARFNLLLDQITEEANEEADGYVWERDDTGKKIVVPYEPSLAVKVPHQPKKKGEKPKNTIVEPPVAKPPAAKKNSPNKPKNEIV
jgi:hypothetical protein